MLLHAFMTHKRALRPRLAISMLPDADPAGYEALCRPTCRRVGGGLRVADDHGRTLAAVYREVVGA